MALKVGELFASFNLDTSGVDSAVKGAEKSLSDVGKGLAIGGAAMTAAVTAPLVSIGKDIYKAGSEFDSQMSKVFAIAGDEVTGSAEAMDKLRAKALEMGSTTQFTATEAGEAFEYMAMAGWKTDQMLSAIEPLMNLAAAAGESLGTTSDIVTDAMTAFGLSATDTVKVVKDGMEMNVNAVEYFADILAAASSNSNTNVTMLGESFKYAAPLAGSLGYSLNDVAIALGLMANTGIKSSMAGTSLSRVLQNMAKPSKETAEAMDKLGLSLYDSKGNAKSLRDVMGDFRDVAKKNGVDLTEMAKKVSDLDAEYSAGKITEEQYEKKLADLTGGSGDFLAAVTQIAGARGLPGLLAIMNASDEDFEKLVYSIDNATGSAKKMKEVMLDNVGGAVTIFKSAVEGLEITLWDLVKGPTKSLIERGTGIIDKFRQMDSATQMGALKMGAFAAALGPVMTASGGLLMALPKIAKAITMLSSPLGLMSIGLLAIGAGAMDAENLMGKNLEKMAKTAATSMKKFNKSLLGKNLVLSGRANRFLTSVQSAIKEAGPVFMDTLAGVLQTGISALGLVMPKAAETATTLVKTIAEGIARKAPTLMKSIGRAMTSLATSVIGAVPDMLHAGAVLFKALIDAVGEVNWLDIGKKLNKAVTDALKEIRTNFYTLVFGKEPTEEDLGDWGKLGSKICDSIKAGIKTASQNGKNLIGGLVLGDDYKVDDSWGTVAGKIWNKITAEMGNLLKNAGDLIKGLVLGEGYTADTTWGDVATAIWNKIKESFTKLKANAKDLIGTIALGNDYTADATWETIGQAIWDKIKAKLTTLKANAKEIIGTLALGEAYTADTSWEKIATAIWSKIQTKFSTLGKDAKNLIGTLVLGDDYKADTSWGTIAQAIWDKAKEKFDSLAKSAKTLIGTLVLGSDYTADTSWETVGQAIWDKAKAGFDSLAATAKNIIGTLVLGKDYTADKSWENIGTAIWNKAKEGFRSAFTFAKDIIGEFVLGANYEADTSWSQIGSAIWEKAKTGFSSAFTAAKEIIGEFVLGDDYTPDSTWGNIGSKIWETAKNGFKNAYKTTKEIIGQFALGDDYTADATWEKVGLAIWDKIKEKLTSLSANAKQLIGSLVFKEGEEGYKADPSWAEIGSKLWDKVKEGIGSAGDFALYVFEKIKNINIDVAGVVTTIKNAGTFLTNLVSEIFKGRITWTNQITSLATSIVDKLKDYGWTGLGGKLGQIARNLVGAITGAIPNAIDAAGNAIDVGMELAGGIMDSITAAFSGEGLDLNVGNIVQSLVSKLTSLVPKAFELGGKMLSTGAHIAQSIFGSIATALSDLKASGISETLSNAATELLKNLLQNIGGLNNNAEVNTFLANLGKSIMDGMGTLGSIVGDFAGKLIGYLFSEEGLKSLYNAGTSVIELILKGMAAGMAGVINFFGNMIDNILIQVGVIDPEARDAAAESGRRLAETMATGMQSEMKDSLKGQTMQTLMEYFLSRGNQGQQYTGQSVLGNMLAVLNADFDQAVEKAGDNAEVFRDEIYDALIENLMNSKAKDTDLDFWRSLGIGAGIDTNDSADFWGAVFADLGDVDISDYIKSVISLKDILPEDLNFWSAMLAAYKEGDTTKLMDLMTAQGIALFGEAAESAKTAAEEAAEQQAAAVAEFQENTGTAATEIKESTDGIVQAMDEGTNELAKDGMAKAIKDEGKKVEAAAQQLSDDTVKEFLLTMSADNGYLIGENFVLAMGTAMSDQTDPMSTIAKSAGQAAYSALSGSASHARGYNIGYNFGRGFVAGIRSMISEAARAAEELGLAGAGGLSNSIQEGSPSKLTANSGKNFDLGFINSILDGIDTAGDAAFMMGINAAMSLSDAVNRLRNEAVDELSIPVAGSGSRAGSSQYETQNNAEQIATAIAKALDGSVIQMNGEKVGVLVFPTVSELIAANADAKRWGTE